MAYDPALLVDEDKVRLMIGDVDNDNLMFQDSEVAYFLALNNDDLYSAAADMCETVAARFARDVNYRFSTLWQDAGDAYDHYMKLAEAYRKKSGETPGNISFTSSVGADDNVGYPEHIWYEMHDNPPRIPEDT